MRLSVRYRSKGKVCRVGESIAINGACLTAASVARDVVSFDVIAETLRKTNLGDVREGDIVNFERSMRSTDLIGGHLVAGHIDGTGRISEIENEGGSMRMTVRVGKNIGSMISEKGFVAVDGVSLTPADVSERRFSIYLIPETRRRTVFGIRRVGDSVNIEIDIFAKYVKKFVDAIADA
jgi:riboflavin synthase